MIYPQTLEPANLTLVPERIEASPFEDLAAIHAAYEPRIFRFLLLQLRDRDLALSITQDTFLKAWRTRASFRGECSPSTWLTRIAISLLRTHTRTETFRFWKRAATTAVDATDISSRLPSGGRSAEAVLIAQQSLDQVWRAVEDLSDRQRTVFLLRFVEEQELSEIATAMDIPLATVKTHLYRALEKVRSSVAPNITSTGKARP